MDDMKARSGEEQQMADEAKEEPAVLAGSVETPEVQESLDYDTWIQLQNGSVQSMLKEHLVGLRNALSTERESRKGLEKQVRDLALKAEKGSEAQTQLTQLADQMGESDRRAEFYEQAHAAGVTNLKLAYLVAQSEDLIDPKRGADLKAMRERFPELFASANKAPAGNAGSGTSAGIKLEQSMNEFIRTASGRRPRG